MLKSKISTVIVILAAGASKRMGAPKQLLKWGNNTLLEHAIATALQIEHSEVIVVLGANYNLIKKQIEQYPVTILNNTQWQAGLGKSIACAVEYIKQSKNQIDALLVTLADQPLLDAGFLKLLVDEFEANKKSIIATSYNKEKLGVPALFDVCYLDDLFKLDTDTGAKHLLGKYNIHVKSVVQKNKTIDLDTKADYEQLYKVNFNK